jgi:hypothetical protein
LNSINISRIERQNLINKINNYDDYINFFRLIQPVSPIYFSEPGDPPSLVHRTLFDDKKYNDKMRSIRKIIKGRFQGGNVGYVYFDDIEIYIAAYKKELTLDFKHDYILKLIRQVGPLTCHQIKDISGMLSKQIMPILHELQKAFILYEDQVDSDWERSWYIFESEFDVNINKYSKGYAISELIKKTLYLLVFADLNMLKGWLRLTNKDIKTSLDLLIQDGVVNELKIDGNTGYCLSKDSDLINQNQEKQAIDSIFVLHRSDFLVKSSEHILKDLFKDYEVLQYILIDGEFKGAVCGHWRIGPHDVDDIVLLLDESEKVKRKFEIIEAVKMFYKEPFSKIIKYDGKYL